MKNINKDRTKKEHYVPRFYLEQFSNLSASKKENKIYIFDKQTQQSYSSDIKDTATNSYFYDFPIQLLGEDKEKIFDSNLQLCEDKIALYIDKFLKRLSYILILDEKNKNQSKIIKNNDQKIWSLILAIQVLRTPKLRKLLNEVKKKADKNKTIENLLKEKISDYVNQSMIYR